MGFSRQEYWSGVPLPYPVNTSIPIIEEETGLEGGRDLSKDVQQVPSFNK